MDSSDSSYYSRQQLDELFLQMIAFFSGDPKRISKDWIIRFWWRQIFWSIYMKMTSIVTELNRHISKFSGRRPEKKFLIRCIQMKDE